MFKEVKEEKRLGIEKGGLFYSNSVEVLFEHLKLNLFPKEMDLFSQRIVLAPSLGMKQWIQMKIATSCSVSCGLDMQFLNQGIAGLLEQIYCPKKTHNPSKLELFLLVFNAIGKLLDLSDPLVVPLIQYIGGKEKRKISVANHLTQLFEKYAVYGHIENLKINNWQQLVWKEVFQQCDVEQNIIRSCISKEKIPDLSVHLFAFSHISPLYFEFFCKTSQHVPVYIYQLSPCQEFWSDLTEDHSSLLVSFGKVAREMAKMIEKSEVTAEESYLIFAGNTRLKQLQRELLTLQPEELLEEDDSLQIHISTTPHNEVLNLYRVLHKLLETGQVEPKDVIVMAPQIENYVPYIQSIFGKEIGYQISDLPFQKNHKTCSALFLLLELEEKRWNTNAVLELLQHPLFQKKQGFTEDDLFQIKRWIQQTGVSWGMDAEHRQELLQKAHCSKPLHEGSSTWLQSLGSLVEELAINSDKIELQQGELLGDFLVLIQNLHKELKKLGESKTISDWILFFKSLLDTYFSKDDEEETLFTEFEKYKSHEELYTFSLIYFLLKEHTQKRSVTVHPNHCQAIRFCSLMPMRAIPAKIICMLGMNHDAFPRRDELGSLDLLKEGFAPDYMPGRADFDRSLFLEVILSARQKLIMSYLGKNPYDLTELPPSSVLERMLPYVAKSQIFVSSNSLSASQNISSTFSIVLPKLELPKGEIFINIADLNRSVRSPLRHFLRASGLKFEEEQELASEEPFSLTPLKKSLLRKAALKGGVEYALHLGEKEGYFPIGALKTAAKLQIVDELENLEKQKLERIKIEPFPIQISEDLTAHLWGEVEDVYEEGLANSGKKSFKAAVKALPNYLVLNSYLHKQQNFAFLGSNDVLSPFFEDPKAHLKDLICYHFQSQKTPLYFTLEWIEPILKQDVKKLEETEIYDAALQWQIRGRGKIDYNELLSAYHPLVEKLYRGMHDAWF